MFRVGSKRETVYRLLCREDGVTVAEVCGWKTATVGEVFVEIAEVADARLVREGKRGSSRYKLKN